MIKIYRMTQKRGEPLRLMAGGALVLLLAFSSNAWAEEAPADPFSALQKWVAVDDYASVNEALVAAQKMNEETEVQTQSQKAPATDPLSSPPSEEPKVAEPQRPLDLPVAQGGGQVLVGESNQPIAEEEPEALMPEDRVKEWMDLASYRADQDRLWHTEKLLKAEEEEGFKVRFSNLPNQDVRSILSGRISKPKLSYQEEVEKTTIQKAPVIAEQVGVDKKKIEADTKACEDLVLYRKRQLEAMESDRKTLAALKAAMTNLGVEKKLSFITTPQQGMAFSGPTGETPPIVTSQ